MNEDKKVKITFKGPAYTKEEIQKMEEDMRELVRQELRKRIVNDIVITFGKENEI